MKYSSLYQSLCAAVLALCCMSATAAEKKQPMSVEDAVLVSVTGSVEDINKETREVTVKGPLGNLNTFTVDKSVKRFDEIKAGDEITANYYISVAAELREPTAEEKKNPIMAVEGAAKAPKGASPAVGGLRMLRVVATVEGLERPTRLVTLKGPKGNYVSVRAADVKRLEKLRLGDTIVVTFTEALAVGLEKVNKQKG